MMSPSSSAPRPRPHGRTRLAAVAGLVLTLGLGGCASVYLVDSEVRSFARWSPPPAPAAPQWYLFDRLPSQNEGPAARAQTELEQLALQQLAPLGWRVAGTDDPAPNWRVQVQASTLRMPHAPWESPADAFGPGYRMGRLPSGQAFWMPGGMRIATPYYERKLSLLVRDARTGQVVYETQAAHDGRWNDSPDIWRAMLSAALRDFPQPPAGQRHIAIEVPR